MNKRTLALIYAVACVVTLRADIINLLSVCSLGDPVSKALNHAYTDMQSRGNVLKSFNQWLNDNKYGNDFDAKIRRFEQWISHANLNQQDPNASFKLNAYQRAIILSAGYYGSCASVANIGNMAAAISLGSVNGINPQSLIDACNAVIAAQDTLEKAVENASCTVDVWFNAVVDSYHDLNAKQATLNSMTTAFSSSSDDLILEPNTVYSKALSLADLLNMTIDQAALGANQLNQVYARMTQQAIGYSALYLINPQ